MVAHVPVEHLYLHFPFCSGRCGYCAFISGPPPTDPHAVIAALETEYAARQVPLAPLRTLYCGGGTPGLIGSAGFQRLRAASFLSFSPTYEWTVELHPATVTPELMATLAACGVNRISIGVQSLLDEVLVRCNRRHTAQQALDAVALARQWIPDTGIDLIAGLPGVTMEAWRETLARVVALDLPHLSVYGLSIDEGSSWAKAGMPPPDAEALCDAILEANALLAAAGYERYETSNYAKPGFQCQHNLNTWHGGDYLGLGHGAASRIGFLRRDGLGAELTLSEEEDALERCLTQLRLREGFDVAAACRRYPCLAPWADQWQKSLALFQTQGLLDVHFAPTARGYEVLDAMERLLLEAVD